MSDVSPFLWLQLIGTSINCIAQSLIDHYHAREIVAEVRPHKTVLQRHKGSYIDDHFESEKHLVSEMRVSEPCELHLMMIYKCMVGVPGAAAGDAQAPESLHRLHRCCQRCVYHNFFAKNSSIETHT